MTLIIQKPTGAQLRMRKTWQPMDPDAAAYITAVEAADTAAGQTDGLEERVKIAIDNFVLGCKADGIWSAIKASCILAGARTLNGALVPLVGTAPTNFNFVAGDYNRKTGLVGDASTKYLNSNRNNNADPQNSKHISVYASTAGSGFYLGTSSGVGSTTLSQAACRVNTATANTGGGNANSGTLTGGNRPSSGTVERRVNGSTISSLITSETPANNSLHVFAGAAASNSNARLAFYSIGEALDLARLDSRVTDLINAIGAAIP